MDLCQYGVVRSGVTDEGNGVQMWMIVANILNKQLRTADKRFSSILRYEILFSGLDFGALVITVMNLRFL